MQIQVSDTLQYFQFNSLLNTTVQHGIFSRLGGVSPDPWRSLNVGGTVGDDRARVEQNQKRVLKALSLDPGAVFDVWQVHSAEVVICKGPRAGREHHKADVILTDQPGIPLMMRFADCVPIMLYDPIQQAIGLAHAGWMGTARGAVLNAVQGMVDTYGSRPGDILAGIGPAIGPDHYEVGEDVIAAFEKSLGKRSHAYFHGNGKTYLDLWSANKDLLETAGVTRIELAGLCTACDTDRWYSHRAEGGKTGRFAAVMSLNLSRAR
jgi:YfiH family protein